MASEFRNYDDIKVDRDGAIVEIVLNRPDRLNPISARGGGTRDQIVDALSSAERDVSVAAVLVHGAGRAFSGGGDLTGNAPRETAAEHAEFLAGADAFHARLRSSRLPIVAAVHGYCLGAALSLVAACDLVIAAQTPSSGFPRDGWVWSVSPRWCRSSAANGPSF